MNAVYLADQTRNDVEVGRNVARMGENRNTCRFGWGNLNEKDYFEDAGVEGRTILKMDLKEIGFDAVVWIHLA
jgi:hypothetical protein